MGYEVKCSGLSLCFEQILYILLPSYALHKHFIITSRDYFWLCNLCWHLPLWNFTGRGHWTHGVCWHGHAEWFCFYPFPVVSFSTVGYPIFHSMVWSSINFLLNNCGSSPQPDLRHQGQNRSLLSTEISTYYCSCWVKWLMHQNTCIFQQSMFLMIFLALQI